MKLKIEVWLAILTALMSALCASAQPQTSAATVVSNRALITAASFCTALGTGLPVTENARVSVTATNVLTRFAFQNGREAIVEMDLQRNEVVCFSAFKNFFDKQYGGSQAQFASQPPTVRAHTLLKRLGIRTNTLSPAVTNLVRISQNSSQEVARLFWRRQTQGFCYKDDYVNLMLDARDGELLGYKKNWGTQPRSLRVNVKLADAKQIASARLTTAGLGGSLNFLSAELWIVTPNDYLSAAMSRRANTDRRLAWVLTLKEQELWVDAETGVFLGGQDIL